MKSAKFYAMLDMVRESNQSFKSATQIHAVFPLCSIVMAQAIMRSL